MTKEKALDLALRIYWFLCALAVAFAAGYLLAVLDAPTAAPGEAEVAIITVRYGEDVPLAETHPSASQEADE
jgi:hypothetical protein